MTRSKVLMAGAASAVALALGYVGVSALTSTAFAAGDVATAAKRIDNFRLASADLQSYELYRMADAPAVVILTQQNGCAASAASAAVLQTLKSQYKDKGVEFLMLNSTPANNRDSILAEGKKLGGDIPILMDANQLTGENLQVAKAGEVIVINPKTWQVAFRGALDAKSGAQVLDQVIAGQPVKVAAKAASGCTIDFPARAHAAEFTKISYAKQVAPILEEKCVACHQPGGIGPMELTSYDKVKGFSPMIREVIRTQRMPPYQADPSVGHFSDDKRLSADQIKTLIHWIEAGAPRGDGVDLLAQTRHEAPEWPLGKPDVILDIPAYTIPASGIV